MKEGVGEGGSGQHLADGDGLGVPPAEVLQPALGAELFLLMRGPGVQSGQQLSRIGPMLRVMCGIAPNDLDVDAVAAVAAWLRTRIGWLASEDVRISMSSAFGLDGAAPGPHASARMRSVAQQQNCGITTVRRRVEAGIESIAAMTTPADSVLHQLRELAEGVVELDYVLGATGEVHMVRCFLIAALRPVDQPNKVYALVRDPDGHGPVTAIPAVRVRSVMAISSPGPGR